MAQRLFAVAIAAGVCALLAGCAVPRDFVEALLGPAPTNKELYADLMCTNGPASQDPANRTGCVSAKSREDHYSDFDRYEAERRILIGRLR